MKNYNNGRYAAPEVCVKELHAERCIAASGSTEPSGSTPGKFDGAGFDWSNFDNFKF